MSSSTRKSNTAKSSTSVPKVTTSTSTSTPVPAREQLVHTTRDITRYTFEYKRDHVSRKAGASYFRVEGEGDEILEMNLQEAQSLYNFLGKALNR